MVWVRSIIFFLNNFILAYLPSQTIRHLFLRMQGVKLGKGAVVYSGFEVRNPKGIIVGHHSLVGHKAVLDGRCGLTIGNNVNISEEVMFWTMQHDYNDKDFKAVGGPITIGDYAWISVRSIILPGVNVGKGAVVAAGAIVTKDVEEFTIVGGIPAKKIGDRNRDLQYTLGKRRLHIV
jgi:acetyltransferase-like isoleucine patch superfamily enzyme